MNPAHRPHAARLVIARPAVLPRRMLALAGVRLSRACLLTVGCSSDKGDKEPTVTRASRRRGENRRFSTRSTTQAILFPRQQAAIVPKISAPVQKFLVKRGSPVHEGQLLAVLENRDLSAAAQENKGAYDQAQAAYETTTGASLPEEIQKAEADAQQAQQALDAQEKVFQSRQQLFEQGALPRKELDQSRVDITQARNQYAIAKKHLDALHGHRQAAGTQIGRGTTGIGQGQVSGSAGATQLLGNSQSDRRRGHRPSALSGRNGRGRHSLAHRDGYFLRHRQGAHSRRTTRPP